MNWLRRIIRLFSPEPLVERVMVYEYDEYRKSGYHVRWLVYDTFEKKFVNRSIELNSRIVLESHRGSTLFTYEDALFARKQYKQQLLEDFIV